MKQLTEADVSGLLISLKRFGTQQVLMSGGEALLNPNFFRLCKILKTENISISLLSTGLTLEKNANLLYELVDEIIVSLDGPPAIHNTIRNLPGAYEKLEKGVRLIKSLDPSYRITARTVIQKNNFRHWQNIIETAKELGLDQISFLPADVSSHAFNRQAGWDLKRQHEILIDQNDLIELRKIIDELIESYKSEFNFGFIAESPAKIERVYQYYAAFYGLNPFPYKKCNAPWVSTVIEADGTVRPCFFHDSLGNIHQNTVEEILNSESAIQFRKNLDMDTNSTCLKCVCYLNLSPAKALS